jgi:hypothetical protein
MSNIKMEKIFDLVCHMNQNPEENYVMDGKVTLNRRQQARVLKKSIQAFIFKNGEKSGKEGKKVIQAFSGSSDLPELTKDVFNVTLQTPNFDLSWQNSFRGVQLMKGQLSWEIANVANGMIFELIPEGDKCKFYGVSGVKQIVDVQKYGAGVGLTWEIIEGRKLAQFINLMETARAKLFKLWADIHYGLLATACATNPVTWQGVATDPILERDIKTINKGYLDISDATKDKGYGDTANAEMLIYANPTLKSRILQALRATSVDIIRGRRDGAASSVAGEIVEYNVTPYFSWNSSIAANKALMVLPGQKIQNSVYLRELGLSEKDIATLSELRSYWTAFGAAIGDNDQCAELAFV